MLETHSGSVARQQLSVEHGLEHGAIRRLQILVDENAHLRRIVHQEGTGRGVIGPTKRATARLYGARSGEIGRAEIDPAAMRKRESCGAPLHLSGLLERKGEPCFGRNLHHLALGDCLGSAADRGARCCADGRALTAAGQRAHDGA